MPYTDMFNEGLDDLADTLATITGYPVVTDPRNINPPCVLLGAPAFDSWNYNIAKLTFPVTLIGSGPGNLDALRVLLQMAAKLMAKNVAVTSGRPTVMAVGGAEFPAYDLQIPIQVQNG